MTELRNGNGRKPPVILSPEKTTGRKTATVAVDDISLDIAKECGLIKKI